MTVYLANLMAPYSKECETLWDEFIAGIEFVYQTAVNVDKFLCKHSFAVDIAGGLIGDPDAGDEACVFK